MMVGGVTDGGGNDGVMTTTTLIQTLYPNHGPKLDSKPGLQCKEESPMGSSALEPLAGPLFQPGTLSESPDLLSWSPEAEPNSNAHTVRCVCIRVYIYMIIRIYTGMHNDQ